MTIENPKKTAGKPIIVGNVVKGKDCYNRDLEIAKLMDLLSKGANVLLLGQRRIGKSSLMLETANRLQNKIICLYVDVQHCDSAKDTIIKLGNTAKEHRGVMKIAGDFLTGLFRNAGDAVEEFGKGFIVPGGCCGATHWGGGHDHCRKSLRRPSGTGGYRTFSSENI